MPSSKEWIEIITALNRLTKQEKLTWSRGREAFIRHIFDYKPINPFIADYKGREFVIFEYDRDENLTDIEVLNRSPLKQYADMLRPRGFRQDRVILFVKDKDQEEFVEVPRIRPVEDLYDTVLRKTVDTNSLLKDLKADAEEPATQNQ